MVKEKVCDTVEPLKEPFCTLISAAVLAPSGDNTQPWRFEVDEAESTITVCVDETRDTSPMNAGQRMARIACGAAIENILQTAEHNRWNATLEIKNDGQSAAIRINGYVRDSGTIEEVLYRRCTNRHIYDGRTLSPNLIKDIHNTCNSVSDPRLEWITCRSQLLHVVRRISIADATMFGEREFLSAFLANVRLDLPYNATANEGLPTGTLGLTWHERRILPWAGRIANSRLGMARFKNSIRSKTARLIASSAGICVIASHMSHPTLDVDVGRTMQRVWLALTRHGIAVQPMMSLPVLRAFCELSDGRCTATKLRLSTAIDDEKYDDCLAHSLAILRFGHLRIEPKVRTGRRAACVD